MKIFVVFQLSEADKVGRIINIAHGKGEKASKDSWSSIAKARHNRNENKKIESALDLLEKYLEKGRNLTQQQKERWSANFNLTVLDEAIRKIVTRFGYDSIKDLADDYPKIPLRVELEDLIMNIGLEKINFHIIRDRQKDFAVPFGIIELAPKEEVSIEHKQNPIENGKQDKEEASTIKDSTLNSPKVSSAVSTTPNSDSSPFTPDSFPKLTHVKKRADPINSQKHVQGLLKNFSPTGDNRHKVVTLKNELIAINLQKTPLAFSFVLRCIFEISAKLYCEEHKISLTTNNKRDKTLRELLNDAVKHLTEKGENKGMYKVLHGAITEIGKHEGLLSVTSMNQLMHSINFSISPPDICTTFNQIYPLLEALN